MRETSALIGRWHPPTDRHLSRLLPTDPTVVHLPLSLSLSLIFLPYAPAAGCPRSFVPDPSPFSHRRLSTSVFSSIPSPSFLYLLNEESRVRPLGGVIDSPLMSCAMASAAPQSQRCDGVYFPSECDQALRAPLSERQRRRRRAGTTTSTSLGVDG